MAKRGTRARAAAAVSEPAWVGCAGYRLEARNSNTDFIFELNVTGDDGNPYHLRVRQLNDRTGLVQKVLRLMADRWPAYDWHFRAGEDGSVTDIQ